MELNVISISDYSHFHKRDCSMIKVGVIGITGGWSSERLADSIERMTGFRLLIDFKNVAFNSKTKTIFYKDTDLAGLDGIIIKKAGSNYNPGLLNRLELLHYLELKGVRIFSKPMSIVNSLSRLINTIKLQGADIPMPETVITEDIEKAIDAVLFFKRAVFKPLFSSKARGMMILSHEDSHLKGKVISFNEQGNAVMYVQKMVDIPVRDLGVAFLGGSYLATYARIKNGNSWNTTIHAGGRYEAFDPGKEIIDLAYKAQGIFNLDFTSVDVVETKDGPQVFEVSAFGGFRGLLDGNNIDAADLYADYVLKKIRG